MEVRTADGRRYLGVQLSNSARFLGIPYAAAPIGNLRFHRPAAAPITEHVHNSTNAGATPQLMPFAETTTIPEPSVGGDDILNLNVFTPAPGDTQARMPVLVWIHGGGFFSGSPISPWYDGRAFNRDGVVVVTVAYRLGFDGFGWMTDAPLNRGILDQIAALTWVHEHIHHFGGDPDAVTIAGQSAGAASVLALLTSPHAEGLFHRAISQSGAIPHQSIQRARQAGQSFAAALRVEPSTRGWRSISRWDVASKERAHNEERASRRRLVERLQAAQDGQPFWDLAFMPVVDGDVVLDGELAIGGGTGSQVPLLLGATAHEISRPSEAGAITAEDLRRAGVSSHARNGLVHHAGAGEQWIESQLESELAFRGPTARAAAVRAKGGAGERTWLYDFRQPSTRSGRAEHCHDVPYVFDLLSAVGVEESLGRGCPQPVADAMHGDWVSFVKSGRASWSPVSMGGLGAFHYSDNEHGFRTDSYELSASLGLVDTAGLRSRLVTDRSQLESRA
ncbi:para-nitrobenzyl esterase [Microbacterium enclense]|uniref:Carboxylic ester hydrolase n=1 Tax=Microbacterium enclense TaxID=993073 RepID=A0A1G6JFT9_9MICO|nr:para-nitrobenzyl esterase [Microbacterium enclense]